MTRDEIKTRTLQAIGDNVDDPVFFTDDQINALVDEANEVLCEETGAIHRSALVPLRPGMRFIYTPSIAADIMAPTRVWDHSTGRRLTALSMDELDGVQERWSQTVGGPPQVWFPVSWDIFGIYPASASAGGVLRIDYQAWPRDLMDDDDRPEIPEATQDAIVLFTQYLGILKKWDSQNAMIAAKALQAHKSLAGARSGISKINFRTFQRMQQPHAEFGSALNIGER